MIVGFAGAGNMAAAMARGWAGAQGRPERMLFCDLDAARARALADEVGGETRERLAQLAEGSDVVLLAVKPDALEAVASDLGARTQAVLSVMAATSTERLGAAFPETPVLRVMPNQPVEVRRGVICHPPPVDMERRQADQLLGLLGELGTVIELEEGLIEAAMAVMSCSPAYVALFAEALAEAGEREGLDRTLSREMVAEAFAGTARLLRKREPAAIRGAVAPPGGATEAGLAELERAGLAGTIDAAVRASLERFR